MSATHLSEPLLSVREAAALLSIGVRTLYALIERGEIPAYKVGGQWRFSRAALADWLATRHPEGGGL